MTTTADTISPSPLSPPNRKRFNRMTFWRNAEGWLFASPWILGFILWTAGPMIASLFIAFTEWDLVTAPEWVGFENISRMFNDKLVWKALRVTSVYAFVSVPLHLVFGMALALLLNANIRGLRWYRTAFYLPSVLSGVAVALLWRWLFSGEFGLFNAMLSYVGIDGPSWLGDPQWALRSLIVMSLWGVGAGAIIYLAGLQGIPTDLYEAAEVDGARGWDRLWNVTIPMMTPVLFFQLVTGLIAALQVFTQAFIMTNGGPNHSTLFFLLYLYQNAFNYWKMGYASALAWILFIYILILTLIMQFTSNRWVYYEGEEQKA
ncbi:MAG: sugar ABC transporter permease [Chloroflexota bacterium]